MANSEHLEILKEGVVAWNKWRGNNLNIFPDLSNADLGGRKLNGANFSDSNLSKTNFQEAKLIGANFSKANLWHASLFRANMFFAYFDGANLIGSNLSESVLNQSGLLSANLTSANLSGTDLSGADLNRSSFCETILGNTNLTNSKNLETIIHRGPSTIDHRTATISGNLPLEFLRGCGLNDWQIKAAKLNNSKLATDKATKIADDIMILWSAHPIQTHSYFISFGQDDLTFAGKLYNELQKRGIRVWLNERQLLPGNETPEHLQYRGQLWDKVLLCCSNSSLTSSWIEDEINLALEKEQKLMKDWQQKVLTFIPLDLDGFISSTECDSDIKQAMVSRTVIDFTDSDKDDDKFDRQLERIIQVLRADLVNIEQTHP